MAGSETIYSVKVRYAVDGEKASGGLKEIARHADKASESVFSIKGALEALAIKEVFSLGKEALVDFNSEIDQMKIGMTTVMEMNLHMPFEKANKEADKLFETFQALAKKSPLTTKDFMEMATMISPAIAMAGGGPEKLAKITQGALTAGLAYGQRADIVGMDVQEMMMGNVTKRNRLGNELLGSIGMDHKEFNDKSAKERAELVEKMFSSPGLQKAADRFGETFKGQTSTFKDNLQIALGQVGRPLMEAMTAEAKKINMWIEKNPKAIQKYVTEFGNMIKGTFEFIKGTAGWLVENKDLIFSLAKTFLVFKGAQVGANIFKQFASGASSMVDKLKDAGSSIMGLFSSGGGIGGAFKGLVGAISGIGGAIPALGLFVGALEVAWTFLNSHNEADKKGREAALSLNEATGDFPGMISRKKYLESQTKLPIDPELKERFMTELGSVKDKLGDKEQLGLAMRKISESYEQHGGLSLKGQTLGELQSAFSHGSDTFDSRNIEENTQIMHQVEDTLKLFNNMSVEDRRSVLKYAFPEQWGTPTDQKPPEPAAQWGGVTKPEVNITIQKIEVASEDPDRFVFGLVKIGEQATKHKTASQHATPGGF